ncbi:hypothetical protein [Bradyrhizobium sp. UNPF46]|uniref:hypothetical protein n=1 Tax=Bradyrhizobium sp. UNPF46 TaxID=1141168 RepID=UPI0011505378|nr:hypothetical protein [Bradyrhizobium sp. UNPF46]
MGFVKFRGLVTPDEPGASPGSFGRFLRAANKSARMHGEAAVKRHFFQPTSAIFLHISKSEQSCESLNSKKDFELAEENSTRSDCGSA